MKTLHYLCLAVLFSCLCANLSAQYVTIPDSAFRVYLTNRYPQCMSGGQLDTTCAGALPDSTFFIVENKGIKDLYGIQFFDSLTVLACAENQLTDITALPDLLKYVTFRQNRLTSIAALPPHLIALYVNDNLLTALPPLPLSLRTLDISQNQFAALPVLPDSLTSLTFRNNLVTSMQPLPPALELLDAGGNALQVLPALPPTLNWLDCGSCLLTALPALPAGITYLICTNNQLTVLPALPDSLHVLVCVSNQLTALPTLPAGLTDLGCAYNHLTALPLLPPALYGLNCFNNRLTSLPALPATLNQLGCKDNLLTSLPVLPDSLSYLDCSSNPQLHCLPRLTRIGTLVFDSAVVTCVPNYGEVYNSTPNIANYPLCAPGGSCPVFYTLSGTVYADANSDCIQQQPAEANVPYLKVNLRQGGNIVQQTYTAGYGVYSFLNGTGSYTLDVDTTGVPFVVGCPANGVDTANVVNTDSVQQHNFALQCKPGFDVAVQSISSYDIFRPANFTHVYIKAGDAARFYRQTCNTLNVSGELVVTITGPVTYISPAQGALTPTVAGNVLTYTIADWSAVDPDNDFNILTQVDTTLQRGNFACFDVSVTPAADNDTSNNNYSFCFTVVNSHDPNEKEVSPPDNIDETGDRLLTYTVRFQNTGNAPAINIYITDTLDSDLDAESFQLLAYSFAPQVTIKGRAVRFTFNNINLPDSVNNEPQSHGFVQYKIKVKPNATVGTAITNTAFIYFDFNEAVVTNTTTNTLTLPNGITTVAGSTATMQLYPNPANDMVMINLSDNLTGGSLTLSDVTGRSLNTIAITTNHNQLNTGALANGVYLVTAVKGGQRVVQRLVVRR